MVRDKEEERKRDIERKREGGGERGKIERKAKRQGGRKRD